MPTALEVARSVRALPLPRPCSWARVQLGSLCCGRCWTPRCWVGLLASPVSWQWLGWQHGMRLREAASTNAGTLGRLHSSHVAAWLSKPPAMLRVWHPRSPLRHGPSSLGAALAAPATYLSREPVAC